MKFLSININKLIIKFYKLYEVRSGPVDSSLVGYMYLRSQAEALSNLVSQLLLFLQSKHIFILV